MALSIRTRYWLAIAAGSVLLAAAPTIWADHDEDEDEEEIPFDEAFLFVELNNTDGDLGIHAKIDGDEWKSLNIEGPNERKILNVRVKRALRRQGLTEFFFESAEPTFDELPPEVFFHRFPEGTYEIEGRTVDGEEMESETEFTHLVPAQPEPLVNDMPHDTDCDDDDVMMIDTDEVVLTWPPVTMSHPELGRTNEPIEVVNYEVVVEIDETPFKVSAILPPDATSFVVPEEILELGDEIKFEVLVREYSYNQTAVESCFVTGDGEEEEEEEEEEEDE